MQPTRLARISELMVAEISRILLRRIKDPRVRGVTVTGVRVARDLRTATVYFSLLPGRSGGDRDAAGAGLNHAAGFIRSELFHTLRLKHVPTLRFEADTALERGIRIQELLRRTCEDGEDHEEEQPGAGEEAPPRE